MPARLDAFQKVLDELDRQHNIEGLNVFEVGFLRGPNGGFQVRIYEGNAANEATLEHWAAAKNVIHIPPKPKPRPPKQVNQ